MNYSKYTNEQLQRLKFEALKRENLNAAKEINDFIDFYGKLVKVVKGRKVPLGTIGNVFWLKRYDNSKYNDRWGIYSTTRIGIKTNDGKTFFTSLGNVVLA